LFWSVRTKEFIRWTRVARWYVFKPKIQIWVNYVGPGNGRCWYILWPFGQSPFIWYI
jgi:hypothetical protein